MTAVEIMDIYSNAATQAECDIFMAAYERLYGVDSAPFWARRYPESIDDGVEQTQASMGH